MKEIMIGRIFKANKLLIPLIPKIENYKNENELIEDLGYKISPDGKREKYGVTMERIKSYVRIIFSLMSDDAYIARLFQYLVVLLNFNINQQSCTIILTGLEVAAEKLICAYTRPMK